MTWPSVWFSNQIHTTWEYDAGGAERVPQMPLVEGIEPVVMIALGWLSDDFEPALFVSLTSARMVEPTSSVPGTYELPVAPGMSTQLPPAESHRRNCTVNVPGVPGHVPGMSVRPLPTTETPARDGAVLGVLGATAVGKPPPFAVSASRYVVPQSVADSTAVPSPHSLNVETSWNAAPEASMELTFCVHVVGFRVSRGAASVASQKPG